MKFPGHMHTLATVYDIITTSAYLALVCLPRSQSRFLLGPFPTHSVVKDLRTLHDGSCVERPSVLGLYQVLEPTEISRQSPLNSYSPMSGAET